MQTDLNKLVEGITFQTLSRFWPGFSVHAFTIYDEHDAYLFHHPLHKRNGTHVKRDDQFNGCTVILFDEHPTAIVDVRLYPNEKNLMAILVHELFHVHQHANAENRFPNEMIGMSYPLSIKNIELRTRERVELDKALKAKDTALTEWHCKNFIELRLTRMNDMEEYVRYENLVEAIEGPAWYVESKALSYWDSGGTTTFSSPLTNAKVATQEIRRSCYHSGMAMCLLLDELNPDWKKDHFQSGKTMFDQLMDCFAGTSFNKDREEQITQQSKELFVLTQQLKLGEFNAFELQQGIHVYISGEVTIKEFDPMNVICLGQERLYKTFINVSLNGRKCSIHQPVLVELHKDQKRVNVLHLVVESARQTNENEYELKGIGVMKGHFKKQGFFIYV
ncbi:hypothetical protein NSQ54_01975 [Alkalihalobacillus sp. FSL W8-0930]